MSEIFSGLLTGLEKAGGQIASSAEANPLKAVGTGIGAIQSVLAERKRNAILKQYLDLINNPEKSAATIRALTQPLNQNLVQDINNQTQGYLAERGLSESPEISQAVLSQTLAPYEQQNQQTAMDEYYRNLSDALTASNPNLLPYEPNITNLLASFGPPGTSVDLGPLPAVANVGSSEATAVGGYNPFG